MGAANPPAAARDVRRHARDAGLGDVRCAIVLGDDVAELAAPAAAAADHGVGRAARSAAAEDDLRQRLSRRRRDLPRARDRRAGRDHRPRRRPLALRRAGDAPLRLALRRLAADGGRHRRRPPARVRRPGERRLLRRPRQEGRAGPRAPRLSVRRRDRRRRILDLQGRGHRRPRGPRHLQGAAAVRAARSRGIHHPGLRARRHRPGDGAGRARSSPRLGREARGRGRRPTRSRSATTTASSARARSPTPASTRWRRRSGRPRSCSSGSRTAA